MNILVYIPVVEQQNGGTRQYSVGLLKLLAEDNSNKYFIYHNNNDAEVSALVKDHSHLQVVTDADVNYKQESYLSKKVRGLWNKLAGKFGLGKQKLRLSFIDCLCTQFKIDVIHCPYQFIPVTKKAKLITTLHDIQEIHFPEYFTAEIRAYRANAYLDFVRRADMVIVSYDHVKQDLIKYFDVPENKLGTLLLKMDQLWFDKYPPSFKKDLSSMQLPNQFLLYPANTWKHKNHLGLLTALHTAKGKYNVTINIVCTGHKTDHYAAIEETIERLGLGEQVLFTGIVDEETLYTLYQSCKGVVIPTSYEAGSFPLYESILMNVPVICSNVTSLPETIGSDDFVFDPFNEKEMAEKMISLWNDENFRRENLEQLKIQAKKIKENDPLPVLQMIYNNLDA